VNYHSSSQLQPSSLDSKPGKSHWQRNLSRAPA
jgi:hypothetical protein